MRIFISYRPKDIVSFKKNILFYSKRFSHVCILDSNNYPIGNFEMLAAIDVVDEISPLKNCFDTLRNFQDEKKDWLFGFLSYDLKNEVEDLSSNNVDRLNFPLLHFFQPRFVLIIRNGLVEVGFITTYSSEKEVEQVLAAIENLHPENSSIEVIGKLTAIVKKKEYITIVNALKQHIHRGDIYEINYCIEYYMENREIDPYIVFSRLNKSAEAPYSAFYQYNTQYILCGSPELYLGKYDTTIVSQPIKGTSKRGDTALEDSAAKQQLLNSRKEQSENVMIVDLVRNDLSRTCNNVQVQELCGIYTFKHWHQMISNIQGTLKEGYNFTDVIRQSFPMGSMTGAPKKKAMELIEKYEKSKRSTYSGSIGFINPEGDFSFNVVIRSILYDQNSGYLSFHVGSAITSMSIPENEYEECLLKANTMLEALQINKVHTIDLESEYV